ncbi:MerR family transcriptional regulator [Cellulosimicrobium cellulans]|uniref:MerR family transcriptional regulator n=1 Tax=Cellulosimicrobium cellulans TaxID=1710 RepID=A0A1Y0HSR7_CELCE|nr:MerR family transcriptional regulator [Cellulosimicrobium cellulans]ARU51181.1 MerR family transcriptional regulator [Cellulosimicrobium cellulans]
MTTLATDRGLTIAEAAEATGLTTHTLRYYERDGLLPDPVERASSGHRRYREQDLGWITLVTRLRATGMPVREVRAYAELVRAGEGNEAERLDLLRAHRERVRAELAAVSTHLDAIEHKIDVYEARAARGEC